MRPGWVRKSALSVVRHQGPSKEPSPNSPSLSVSPALLPSTGLVPKRLGDTNNPNAPDALGRGDVNLKLPDSLKREHDAYIECLQRYVHEKGDTGTAVKDLLRLVEPHLEKDNELVLPLLAVFAASTTVKPLENPGRIMRAYETYSKQYPSLFAEHALIRQAIGRARRAASVEGYSEVVNTLDALARHALVEEEVLYPAALLVGMAAQSAATSSSTGDANLSRP